MVQMQVSLVLVLTVTLTGEGYIAAEMPNPISYVGCSGTSGADSGGFGESGADTGWFGTD